VSLNYSSRRFDATGHGLELRQGCPCFLGRVRVNGVIPEYPGGGQKQGGVLHSSYCSRFLSTVIWLPFFDSISHREMLPTTCPSNPRGVSELTTNTVRIELNKLRTDIGRMAQQIYRLFLRGR
jgi:hypothetical protein